MPKTLLMRIQYERDDGWGGESFNKGDSTRLDVNYGEGGFIWGGTQSVLNYSWLRYTKSSLPVSGYIMLKVATGLEIVSARWRGNTNANNEQSGNYTHEGSLTVGTGKEVYQTLINQHTIFASKVSAGIGITKTSKNIPNKLANQTITYGLSDARMDEPSQLIDLIITLGEAATSYEVGYHLIGCSSSFNQSEVEVEEEIDIIITKDEGLYWHGNPYILRGGVKDYLDYNATNNTFYLLNYKVMANIVVYARCVEEHLFMDYTSGCSLDFSSKTDLLGDRNIILTPNLSFRFTEAANLVYKHPDVKSEYYSPDALGNITIPIQVDYFDNNTSEVEVFANAFFEDLHALGFVAIYKLTRDQLIELSTFRYETMDVEGNARVLDNYQWIVSVRRFYVSLESPVKQHIMLGLVDTEINGSYIIYQPQTFSIGSYAFPNVDSWLGNRTTYRVGLPFIGLHLLETSQVQGKIIDIEYVVDPLNGDCVALLIDFNTKEVLYSYNGNISTEIPIVNINTETRLGGVGSTYNAMNGLDVYIESESPEAVIIEDLSGLVYLENVQLQHSSKMFKDERREILTLLHGGVIV